MPAATATKLLTSLSPFGYPTTDVLRYIASTSTLRAIGTAIDPNILGALLMLTSAIGIAQVVAPRPVLDRRVIVVLLAPALFCLLLTYSRSSWMGLAAAVLVIASLRYRRLWLVFLALGVAIYFGVLPQGEGFLGHLQSGLAAQDQAAAMRLGEYSDAFKLIGQYPWFGVGFGAAPSIDLYVGVSSIYLLMAENMGLIGVAAFLIIMFRLAWQTLGALRHIDDEGTKGMVLATAAALVAALVAGIFDHYFFNLQFPHTVALFWLLVGLTVVGVQLGLRNTQRDPAAPSGSG
jgi:O-antigen ligase